MFKLHCTIGGSAAIALVLGACSPEPPPRKVSEFLEDPIALEATLSRCNADRSRSRDDVECKNAREAGKRISTAEEEERQRLLEEESRRKLEAIRRRNEAMDQRRREAEEAARRLEELQYEQQFAPVEGAEPGAAAPGPAASEPEPAPAEPVESEPAPVDDGVYREETIEPSQFPVDESVPESLGSEPANDLESLRQELQRRSGSQGEEAASPE
ncbi:MAG: EexN family lipoprotein [Pseudomonadota bacterium]